MVLLVPSMYSNVENEDELLKKGASASDIEALRKKQCLKFLTELAKLFWDKRWRFKTKDGSPVLVPIRYGEDDEVEQHDMKDTRFLCIFSFEGVQTSTIYDGKSLLEKLYLKKLFIAGWEEATNGSISELALYGSHHANSTDMAKVLSHLNLKQDGTDVVVDIGYGTSALLFGLAAVLQGTRVIGSENDEEVFQNTEKFISSLSKTT